MYCSDFAPLLPLYFCSQILDLLVCLYLGLVSTIQRDWSFCLVSTLTPWSLEGVLWGKAKGTHRVCVLSSRLLPNLVPLQRLQLLFCFFLIFFPVFIIIISMKVNPLEATLLFLEQKLLGICILKSKLLKTAVFIIGIYKVPHKEVEP